MVPPNGAGVKGWKVTSPWGCFVYIFTTRGNAFYPSIQQEKKCDTCHQFVVDVPADTTVCTPTCDTITIETDVHVHYFIKMHKGKGGSYPEYSDRVYWRTETDKIVVPIGQGQRIITPARRLQDSICKDGVTFRAPDAQKVVEPISSLSCNYQKRIRREMVFVVIKKQYRRIQKDKPPKNQQQQQ